MKKLKDVLKGSNDNLDVKPEDVEKAIKKTHKDIMKAKDPANQEFFRRKLKALKSKDEE